LFNQVFYKFTGSEKDERSLEDGQNFLKRYLPVVDAQLGENEFIAGEKISIADMTLLSALDPAEVIQLDLESYPNVVKWRENLRGQDFYQKCFKSYAEVLQRLMSASQS